MKRYGKALTIAAAAAMVTSVVSCGKKEEVVKADVVPAPVAETPVAAAPAEAAPAQPEEEKVDERLTRLTRTEFNLAAQRLNLPLFWKYEAEPSKAVKPSVLVTLDFYPSTKTFVWKDSKGEFTKSFYDAYELMVEVMSDPLMGEKIKDEGEVLRRQKVAEELDQSAITAVISDFSKSSPTDQAFVNAMLKVAEDIDILYARQTGLDIVMTRIPDDDVLSQSMARRNWGISPESPKLKNDKACRALSGTESIPVGVYPASLQKDPDFCAKLSARPDAAELLTPFTVVVYEAGSLRAVQYSEYFKTEMTNISNDLKEAAQALNDNEEEQALQKYLYAAATSFLTNDWEPANEAWAAMNSTNSKWYVRVAPDEVYWEPCSRKAGFHQTFARINPDALSWQEKLTPVQQEMEARLAAVAGAPYQARQVSFHLPDFIDIITNSGDDRDAFGATIGQSLPNWGPVANEGRGRTVAMSNLYTDPDSLRDRFALAQSLFSESDAELLKDASGPGLLSTILHEAAHNLGPAHEYKVKDKVDDDIFGGALASMAEEFKAQTAAIWYLSWLVEKEIITQDLANKSYADSVYWAFGQISRGMTNAEGRIQPYPQLAAIQVGMMLEDGALTYHPDEMAANGTDKGAFHIDLAKMPATADRIMETIAKIKATGNKAALVALQKKYIDNSKIPMDVIQERMLRLPKTTFVYSVKVK